MPRRNALGEQPPLARGDLEEQRSKAVMEIRPTPGPLEPGVQGGDLQVPGRSVQVSLTKVFLPRVILQS